MLMRLAVCRAPNNPVNYLAFASTESTVGLMEWPPRISLASCKGVVAHPGPAAGVAITSDGRFFLTAAAGGSVVNMFHVRRLHNLVSGLKPEKTNQSKQKQEHS